MDLIQETYEKAKEVLEKNITKNGFTASSEHIANYFSIWARDHSVCSLAALLSKDKKLINCAKNGLLYLLKRQNESGQLPSYVEIASKEKVYGGFGSITSIDSNMWVVIMCAIFYHHTKDKRFISNENGDKYIRCYRLLKAFDSNNCGLMEVHIASDWADIMNRTYHVLYDECLYYESLKALGYLLKENLDSQNADPVIFRYDRKRIKYIFRRRVRAKKKINSSLWFTKKNIPKIKEEYMIHENIPLENYNYYQSHLMPFKHHWAKRFDTFGNLIAVLTNIASKERSKKIINHVLDNKINEPFPLKAMSPIIFKHNKDWEHIYATKEKPYTYHNGGIWPMLTGFWINTLVKNGHHKKAKEELIKLAEVLRDSKYVFHEYYNSKTSKPKGTPYQAWSAAGFMIGYHSVYDKVKLFDF